MPPTAIPQTKFRVSAKIYTPRKAVAPCPGVPPSWVTTLVANGASLSLESVLTQAGRHFADGLNMGVFDGSATRRQEATRLAWTLVAMLRPDASSGHLEVQDPGDGDIKRLASEVIGVGAALELLRSQQVIDARTLRKLSTRFDFEANGVGGRGKVLIEAKGTCDRASSQYQRGSFVSKINSHLSSGGVRGYDRAVGIIFSTWTAGSARAHDVEILDPEFEPEEYFEESVREIVRFYARRFDETAGLPEAAKILYATADSEALFVQGSDPLSYLGLPSRSERVFNRSSFTFTSKTGRRTFWGSFWDGVAMPCPLPAKTIGASKYAYAYTGIDRRVIECLTARNFKRLLDGNFGQERLIAISHGDFMAHFLLDRDGVIRGWMNQIPSEIEFEIVQR